ncbi:MAG: lysophospholipid acyltransferase family protein [Fimbriimonas sp.]|nr:lysophospholipid acyltransferase family protein [Fimbriimonas sp.]
MIDLAECARMTRAHVAFWRPIVKVFAALLLFVLGTLRVRGKYRVPLGGGLLILSNHRSDLDPIVVQVACPRPVHFMAKSELFDMPILGKWIRGLGSFPVKRGEPDRAALRLAAQLVNDGEVVSIFPEGEISEYGDLLDLKAGIALIVRMAAGNPVICCGLKNTQCPIPYGQVIPRPGFRKMEVEWGEPRTFTKESTAEEILAWATAQLKALSE